MRFLWVSTCWKRWKMVARGWSALGPPGDRQKYVADLGDEYVRKSMPWFFVYVSFRLSNPSLVNTVSTDPLPGPKKFPVLWPPALLSLFLFFSSFSVSLFFFSVSLVSFFFLTHGPSVKHFQIYFHHGHCQFVARLILEKRGTKASCCKGKVSPKKLKS